MRTHTMKTISRRRRRARPCHALALALGVCALAIPASAGADPFGADGSSLNTIDPPATNALHSDQRQISEPGSPSGSVESPYAGGSEYATPNAILGSDGLGEPTGVVSGSPADTGSGFDWASAAIGAAAAMALATLGGAALMTFRRRTAVSPSPSAG